MDQTTTMVSLFFRIYNSPVIGFQQNQVLSMIVKVELMVYTLACGTLADSLSRTIYRVHLDPDSFHFIRCEIVPRCWHSPWVEWSRFGWTSSNR